MITNKQLLWLKTRGDRDHSDVIYDDDMNPYVLMLKNGNSVPVYIPKDEDIHLWIERSSRGRTRGHVHCENANWAEKNMRNKNFIRVK